MIAVEHVPLLSIHRRLYAIPRGPERFREYVATITGGQDTCLIPPLVAMNPMAREHVAEAVERYIALDAEGVAAAAAAEACRRLADAPVSFHLKLGLVVVDDVRGGWTNRQYIEIGDRLDPRDAVDRYGWLSAVLWAGDPVSTAAVRASVLRSVYHYVHRRVFGNPTTLREILRAEGRTLLFSGEDGPPLDAEDLAYSRDVIAPWLDADDVPRQFACLFGDAAAKAVGYDPMGLSPRAGFAVALDDARRSGVSPEGALRVAPAPVVSG